MAEPETPARRGSQNPDARCLHAIQLGPEKNLTTDFVSVVSIPLNTKEVESFSVFGSAKFVRRIVWGKWAKKSNLLLVWG